MIRLRSVSVVIAFTAILVSMFPARSAEAPAATPVQPPCGPPDNWLPSSTVFLFSSAKPDAALDLILDPSMTGQMHFEKGPAAVLTAIGNYLEAQLGSDWKTALHRTMRNGFAFAAGPGGAVVLIARSEDDVFLEKLSSTLVKAVSWGTPQKVSQTTHAGVNCRTIDGGKGYHAIAGNCLIYSNQLPILEQVLDLRAGTVSLSQSLAGDPEYQAAKQASRKDATAQIFVSPALVRALPIFKRNPQAQQQPLLALLLGRNPQAATSAKQDWLTLDLDVNGRALSTRLGGEQLAGNAAPFASPPNGDGVLPNVSVPRQIAALSAWRDLRGFYAAKDTLFPERTGPLILFENLMGIYFSGRDLTEDVLGGVDPHVRLVVAEQAYDPETGTPSTQVPAFAAIFRMHKPEKFGPIMEEAWQKALGLINFTRGQKAQPGLIMDKRDHAGVRYTFASFSAAEEPDKTKLDVRFNFRPAIVRDGEFLILSSTDQLADDLIDGLRNPAQPVAASNGLVEIDGSRLTRILLANKDGIVRGNMLKKGQERTAAEKDFGNLTAVARLLGQATLRTGEAASQRFVDLKLEFGGAPDASH